MPKALQIRPNFMWPIPLSTYANSGFEGSREDTRDKAEFRIPTSIAFVDKGYLLIVDRFNHHIREVTENEEVGTLTLYCQLRQSCDSQSLF